jgi:hypothetical protein
LHRLPQALKIPGVMDLKTLADAQKLIGHLPKETRARGTWQYVEAKLEKAAAGQRRDASSDRAADGVAARARGIYEMT